MILSFKISLNLILSSYPKIFQSLLIDLYSLIITLSVIEIKK